MSDSRIMPIGSAIGPTRDQTGDGRPMAPISWLGTLSSAVDEIIGSELFNTYTVDARSGTTPIAGASAYFLPPALEIGSASAIQREIGSPTTGTLDAPQITTQTGSWLVVSLSRGDQAHLSPTSPAAFDNKSNTFSLIGTLLDYASFPGSTTSQYMSRLSSSGANHIGRAFWGAAGVPGDEMTISSWEVRGAGRLIGPVELERSSAATITSGNISTTGPAIVVVEIWGTAGIGQDHTFTAITAGVNKWAEGSAESDKFPSGLGYIQRSLFWSYQASPVTNFNATFSGVASEGGIIKIYAFQAPWRMSSGAVPITGTGATLTYTSNITRTLIAGSGVVPIAGTTASLLDHEVITAAVGTVPITGTVASLVSRRLLTCASGAVPITGTAASLLDHEVVVAAVGSIPIIGTAASLISNRAIACDPGSVPITGTTADLLDDRVEDSAAGSVPISGTAVTLTFRRVLTCVSGSIPLTGTDASLLDHEMLAALAGSVPITGTPADLLAERILDAGSGTVNLAGTAVTLLHVYPLAPAPGTVLIAGTAALLLVHHVISASPGSEDIVGTSAGLLDHHHLDAAPGSTPVDGADASLTYIPTSDHSLFAEEGTIPITGTGASLELVRAQATVGGSTQRTGRDVVTISPYVETLVTIETRAIILSRVFTSVSIDVTMEVLW